MKFISAFIYYFPFTPGGTALFGVSVYLLGLGYGQKNFITLFLSVSALGFLAGLYILGRIQALKFESKNLAWKVPPYVYAGKKSADLEVSGDSKKAFLFYRIHLSLSVRAKIDTAAYLRLYREEAFTGEGAQSIPLTIPVSGRAELKGRSKICDIFGMTRNRFGKTVIHKTGVLPGFLQGKVPDLLIEGGVDTKSKRKDSDEDKYYMRDYIPGDRLRDINWKASSRSSDIFTRISPISQEKSRTLYIDFRHFAENTGGGRRAYHLDYIKRWLFTFLWTIKQAEPSFTFDILTGKGRTIVHEEEELIRLAYSLGDIFYQQDPGIFHQSGESSEIYIFTTPYDTALYRAVTEYSDMHIHLFSTSFPGKGSEEEAVRIFHNDYPLLPSRELMKRDKNSYRKNPLPQSRPGLQVREQQIRVRVF